MNNYKIVIDAGHGGSDPGASGNGIIEKDLTLKISQYMYDRFRELGIPVTMTRTTDETVEPTERVNRILNAYGNRSDVIVISNHINAGGADGAEVIYALRNNNKLANAVLESLGKAGQNMRKAYQRRLPSDTSKDYYFIHRNTGQTQPIIVEYGFLDSSGDDVNQLKNNWEELANAVVDAVADYIGVSTTADESVYTVKSGDSLWSIAKRYGVTVNELKSANNLTSNTLSIGQKLKIPKTETDEVETSTYTVKAGDSLYAIARKYNTTVDALKSLNNLTTNTLQIGQKLKIPMTDSEDSITNYITYTVKKGDNLYRIARSYGTTQQEIMNLNNLSSNLLSIGQTLRIPTNGQVTYTVKAGDNLYSIARSYGATVDSLIKKNNLKSTTLKIGQILTI